MILYQVYRRESVAVIGNARESRMKKSLMSATAVAALLSYGFTAHAEEGWYMRADAGYGLAGKIDHDAPNDLNYALNGDSDTDGVSNFGIGLGYKFSSSVRLELSYTDQKSDLEVSELFVSANGNKPPDTATTTYHVAPEGKLNGSHVMVNLGFDFNAGNEVQPYFGIGVGYGTMEMQASSLSTGPNPANRSSSLKAYNGFTASHQGFGWQLAIGLAYRVTDRVNFEFGFRHYALPELEYPARIDPSKLYSVDFSEDVATMGMRWRFSPEKGSISRPPPRPTAPSLPPPPPPPPPPPLPRRPKKVEPPKKPVAPEKPVKQPERRPEPRKLVEPTVTPCYTLNQEFVVYFGWNEFGLSREAHNVIDMMVSNVMSRDDCSAGSVTIVGHSDTSGKESFNVRLSALRADAVRTALLARGIPDDIISVQSKGETALAKNTPDGVREPLNRRSEVTILVR